MENGIARRVRYAAERWVVPAFCTENLTTTEAVLSAALERARELGIPAVRVYPRMKSIALEFLRLRHT